DPGLALQAADGVTVAASASQEIVQPSGTRTPESADRLFPARLQAIGKTMRSWRAAGVAGAAVLCLGLAMWGIGHLPAGRRGGQARPTASEPVPTPIDAVHAGQGSKPADITLQD